jgi:hypothetical protein
VRLVCISPKTTLSILQATVAWLLINYIGINFNQLMGSMVLIAGSQKIMTGKGNK